MDRKRPLRRETAADKDRRSEKKNILTAFLAKSGPFAAAAESAPDAQARITQLEDQLAKAQAAAKPQPEKPVLRLQQQA